MSVDSSLPIETILASTPLEGGGGLLGTSREGREVRGFVFGNGPLHVSLIGGCHADEPVGPLTLSHLAGFLASQPAANPLLEQLSWRIVPHVNPDGRERNAGWSRRRLSVNDNRGRIDAGFDLDAYLRGAVREPPGDDVEFGFPRDADDVEARPENRAVAGFLADAGPYAVHGSLHGMGLAPGPWFLIEPAWESRTLGMRDALRRLVATMGYELFDPDRRGEKGFRRIDCGFSTRPDSQAMHQYFEDRGEHETAALFRPSSMEFVRTLGGDPLTFVSEMPLFLTPERIDGQKVGTTELQLLRRELESILGSAGSVAAAAGNRQVRPMPIGDQMRLQLALVAAAIDTTRRAPVAPLEGAT